VLDYYGINYILIPVDNDNKSLNAAGGREYNVYMGTKEYESYIFTGFRNTGYLVTVDFEETANGNGTVTVFTDRTDMPWGLALELAKMSVPEATDIQFRDNRLGYSKVALQSEDYSTDSGMVIIDYTFDFTTTASNNTASDTTEQDK
jgi:hypothetical protein